jgi:hypothetical protein
MKNIESAHAHLELFRETNKLHKILHTDNFLAMQKLLSFDKALSDHINHVLSQDDIAKRENGIQVIIGQISGTEIPEITVQERNQVKECFDTISKLMSDMLSQTK